MILINKKTLKNHFDISYAFTYAPSMTTLTASHARASFYGLIDEVAKEHQPIQIMGKRNNAILVSEEDWNNIQETLFLLSIPGMRESIRKGLKEPLKNCVKELKW